MYDQVSMLRVSYWVGAFLDAVVGIMMVFPDLFKIIYGSGFMVVTQEFRYAMGMGAPLMFGWTVLLIWADRKPIQRKGILIITVFPVIIGLFINEIYSIMSGLISFRIILPTLILQIILMILFTYSYLNAQSR